MGFFLTGGTGLKTGRKATPSSPTGTVRKAPRTAAKALPIRVLGERAGGCSGCPLDREAPHLHHPRMEPTGSSKPVLYVLGEAPGKQEDEQGRQFIGRSGELLREHLPDDLLSHTRWNNTVRCRPPGNRTPTRDEQAHCSQFQVEDIERTKPLLVLGFGAVPLGWALNQNGIADWRGAMCPVRIGTHTCWYAPIWHPSFVLRMKNDGRLGQAYFETFVRDLQRAIAQVVKGTLDEPYVPDAEAVDAGIDVCLSWTVDEVEQKLARLRELGDLESCDIETNNLRPYYEGAKILSIAFGTWEYSVAIPLDHREAKWTEGQRRQVHKAIERHLMTPGRTFIAHGQHFEMEWLSMPEHFGEKILHRTTWGDTMAQSEIVRQKSRAGRTLNDRSVECLGIEEKTLDEGIDRSRMDEVPLPKVLRYNARDTKFTDAVYAVQAERVASEGLQYAYDRMVSRVPALVLAQQRGLVPNTAFAEAKHIELVAESEKVLAKLRALPVVRQFEADAGQPFNPGSNPQLVELFSNRIKAKEGWQKEKDGPEKYSTREEVLSQIKHPAAELILERRGIEKLDGTYVLAVCTPGKFPDKSCGKHIWPDGLIHTQFNTLVAATGRTSAEEPNVQNYPMREHPEIRNAVMCLLGHRIVAVDYGQIEYRVIAMASHCPVMIKSLWEHYDVHGAWAKILAEAFPAQFDDYYLSRDPDHNEKRALKKFRGDIKNEWTFPLFYGAGLPRVASELRLPANKLKPYWVDFWEMFEAVKKWQEKLLKGYKKNGYVTTLTGRRRYEPMAYNEVINSPIQGTASDIVVDSMEILARMSYDLNRPQLAARINLHDDLTFYLPEVSLQEDIPLICEVMATPRFDWINVPLTVEVKTGHTWGAMEELCTIESFEEYGLPKRTTQ